MWQQRQTRSHLHSIVLTILAGLGWATTVAAQTPEADPLPVPPAAPGVLQPSLESQLRPTAEQPLQPVAEQETGALSPIETETEPAAPEVAHPQPLPAQEESVTAQEEPASAATASIRPSQFQGVIPGRTTAEEIAQKWGEPSQRAGEQGNEVWIYETSSFKQIAINLAEGRARSLLVEFEKPFRPDALAERLKLTAIDAIEVYDAHGEPLGRAYPERGVIFTFKPGAEKPAVAQLLLEPISAELFVQRVESRMHERYADCLRDLATIEKLEPQHARAAWLKSRIQLDLGRVSAALASVDQAIAAEPNSVRYQFTRGQCLAQLGRYDEAIEQTKTALSAANDVDLSVAHGMVTLATLLAKGPEPDYQLAVKLYTEAVRLAEPLTRHGDAAAIDANRLLVEAHLGVAYAIGWGNWREKEAMVAKWLDQAENFANNAAPQDGWRAGLQFEVLLGRLSAQAGFGKPDPEPWVTAADELTGELAKRVDDPLRHQYLRWRLGEAYADAAEIASRRENVDLGLEYAQLAKVGLEQGAEDRRDSRSARYRVGRLFFITGAIHATHRHDHERGVDWFTKAAPLLSSKTEKLPADPGRLGESLVSMGVSFWEVGLRQKALELTERGAQLMKSAVDNGNLHAKALNVPLGNLAAMHKALGDVERAQAFEELAEKETNPPRQ
ncbi:MAG: tetratricopeptide repeat protein [Planctomycetales bacterium]|nr:tetratricopeptide repeat protein [Planctomycetales bacterium]